MKKEELFRALGEIDDEWIEEALEEKRISTWNWRPLMMTAAAAVLLVIGASGGYLFQQTNQIQTAEKESEIAVVRERETKQKENRVMLRDFAIDAPAEQEIQELKQDFEDPVTVIPMENIEKVVSFQEESYPNEEIQERELQDCTETEQEEKEEKKLLAVDDGEELPDEVFKQEEGIVAAAEEPVEDSLREEAEKDRELQPPVIEESIAAAGEECQAQRLPEEEEIKTLQIAFRNQNYCFSEVVQAEQCGEFLEVLKLEQLLPETFCHVYAEKEKEEGIVLEIGGSYYSFQRLFQEEISGKTEFSDLLKEHELE